jgi:hypothetical protein
VIDLTGAGRFIDPEEAMTPTPAIVLSDVKPTLKRVKAASRPRPVTAARRA